MSKYDPGDSRLLSNEVALSDHARHRWAERSPHDCPVTAQRAFRLGEWVADPGVARATLSEEAPDDVRVYCHPDGWGLAFLVVDADREDVPGYAPRVVPTVLRIRELGHEPSRAYLRAHGPHSGGETDE